MYIDVECTPENSLRWKTQQELLDEGWQMHMSFFGPSFRKGSMGINSDVSQYLGRAVDLDRFYDVTDLREKTVGDLPKIYIPEYGTLVAAYGIHRYDEGWVFLAHVPVMRRPYLVCRVSEFNRKGVEEAIWVSRIRPAAEPRKMTKAEIEEIIGQQIEIVD